MVEDDLDRYRAIATVYDMPIRLGPDDVARLPSTGRLVFCGNATPEHLDAARVLADVRVGADLDVFANGFRRLLNTYVAGMHAGYGLAALADPSTFLRAARELADALYGDAAVVVDASPGNAEFRNAIEALYPDAAFVDGAALVDTVRARLGSPRASEASVESPHRRITTPIFVVGYPRSGTTWLQSMLQCHHDVAGPAEETAIFSSIKDLVANAPLRAWTDEDTVRQSLRRFVESMFAPSLAGHADATRLVEKTPHHALHLDIIESLFPDAYVIAIHRDAREVVRSLLEVPFGTDDPGRASRGWVESITAVANFVPRSIHLREVRYESLREDTVHQLAELFDWLGLAVDDDVRARLSARSSRRVSEHNLRSIALDPAAIHAVYRYAGDQMVALGYLDDAELHAIRQSLRYRARSFGSDALRRIRTYGGKLRRLRKN